MLRHAPHRHRSNLVLEDFKPAAQTFDRWSGHLTATRAFVQLRSRFVVSRGQRDRLRKVRGEPRTAVDEGESAGDPGPDCTVHVAAGRGDTGPSPDDAPCSQVGVLIYLGSRGGAFEAEYAPESARPFARFTPRFRGQRVGIPCRPVCLVMSNW